MIRDAYFQTGLHSRALTSLVPKIVECFQETKNDEEILEGKAGEGATSNMGGNSNGSSAFIGGGIYLSLIHI